MRQVNKRTVLCEIWGSLIRLNHVVEERLSLCTFSHQKAKSPVRKNGATLHCK